MNRRQVITSAVIAPVSLGLSGQVMASKDTIEDKYWENQWLINELEQDRQDQLNHRAAMTAAPAH